MLALASKSSDSPLAKADFTELHASDEGIYFEAHPAIGEKYSVILRRAGKEFIETEHRTGASTEIMKHSMHSYAARFCEVRVHDRTSEVRVNRWIGAFDAGRIINPKTAISQFRGGIIMDIGMALTEETLFEDRTGGVMNPSLRMSCACAGRHSADRYCLHRRGRSAHADEIGEIGITGVAAAIANAIYHATGKRITRLPITLDQLM